MTKMLIPEALIHNIAIARGKTHCTRVFTDISSQGE